MNVSKKGAWKDIIVIATPAVLTQMVHMSVNAYLATDDLINLTVWNWTNAALGNMHVTNMPTVSTHSEAITANANLAMKGMDITVNVRNFYCQPFFLLLE